MITLGLNYNKMHDSSACIIRDGNLLFAVAEERMSRIKHDSGFPRMAIQACLDFAKVRADQLDEVCFGWTTPGPGFRHDLKCLATGGLPLTYLNVVTTTLYFLSMWHQEGGAKRFQELFGAAKVRMRFVDHHLAHAISAYAYSGFEDSAVVVMDGRGAWEATSIWHGTKGRLQHVATIPFPNSLGLFYSEFTSYLGFQRNSDEWKVMGLAPYGTPGVKVVSGEPPAAIRQWQRLVFWNDFDVGTSATPGKRNRRTPQEYCLCGAGRLRACGTEHCAYGFTENALP
jgi:carbamoyltransferase